MQNMLETANVICQNDDEYIVDRIRTKHFSAIRIGNSGKMLEIIALKPDGTYDSSVCKRIPLSGKYDKTRHIEASMLLMNLEEKLACRQSARQVLETFLKPTRERLRLDKEFLNNFKRL